MNLALTELLYDALCSPFGLIVQTESAERLRQRLYTLRKESADLSPLSFVISPMNGSDLWILNKGNTDVQG